MNRKYKIGLVLTIILLIVMIFSATYAYFLVNTTNNFGSKTIKTNLGELGSVSLNTGSNLKIDLTASDMMQTDSDKAYYASNNGMTETPTVEAIATAQAVGEGIFQCKYKLKVEEDSTNSMYTAFQNMSTKSENQIILTINKKDYDFNTANLFPLTIDGTITNVIEGRNRDIKVGLKVINNKSVDQTALANTDLLLNFNIEEFSCTATDEEVTVGANELIKLSNASEIAYDGTTDNNLRYIGKNPNNYIYFNCSDYNNPTESTCEKWRIIGAFNNMKNSDGKTKTLYKIIYSKSLGNFAWDVKQNGVGSSSGNGSNDWEDSQLMLMLNGVSLGNYKSGYTVSGDYLLDKNNIRIMNISESYYEGSSRIYPPALATTSGYPITGLNNLGSTGLKNDTTRKMIENVVWNLGAPSSYSDSSNGLTSRVYSDERSTNVYSGRPTEWTGKIGLMYPSDYGYATSGGSTINRETCLATALNGWSSSNFSDCKTNDWLMNGAYQWTLTPFAGYSNYVCNVGPGFVSCSNSTGVYMVRPTAYLTSNIVINGGEGSSTNPYTLKISAN